jgi:proteasome accessory factor B
MTIDDERGRYAGKRDRLARLTRLVSILQAHPEGIRTGDIAIRVGMSVRTVYRDLTALQEELRLPVWGEDGVWGIDSEKAFLPPLKLTQQEAMAVVLSARLMVRYADKYDPDLAAAFEKLERGLPSPLAEHVERTLDGLSKAPRDERFSTNVRLLTKAWAERRVVTIDYEPARYESGAVPRRATVRPYLLEPSLQTHALYLIGFDEERGALRTFKIERIRSASLTPRTFDPPDPAVTTSALRAAWDIIADQASVEVVLRFAPGVANRVLEATWHPTQTVETDADGSLRWRATVSGTIEIRLWILSWGDDVEVLAPESLRDDVAATHRRALERYGRGDGTAAAAASGASTR